MPFKIRTKLLSAFFAIILPFIVIGAILVLYSADTIHKSVHKIQSIAEERGVITNLILAMEKALMPGNDYIITGDKKYIDDFSRLSDKVEKRIKEVKGGLHGSVEEGKILDDTDIAWRGIKEISLKIFALHDPTGRDAPAERLYMEEMDYKWAYPAIERLTDLRETHIVEFQKAAKTAEKAWIYTWIIMIPGAFLVTAVAVFFAFFYSRRLSGPIEKIHNGADAIAAGDFKTRLDIKTGDEIEQLSNAMNEMAAQLDIFTSNLQVMVDERTRELQYERNKLNGIFEAMEDGVYLVDQDYNIQYLNPVLFKEFGPVDGKKCYTYLHDREDICPWCPNQRVFVGETVRWEWTSLKTGKTYDLLDTPMRQADGSIWKLEIFREITEKKRAEEALRHEKEVAQTYLDIANVMFVVIDSNEKVTLVNKRGAEVLGYPESEIMGKNWFDEFLPERNRDEIRGVFRRLMSWKDDSAEYVENAVLTRSGEERLIAWHNAVLKDEAGKIIATLSSGEDITDRKKTEAVFRALAVSNVGAAFFRETVSSLCAWIGVESAIIGELVDENNVRALAMQIDGKAVDHYEYALAGTPCESATRKGYCEYHEEVVQLFPADKDLVDMRAEAYIGTPIRDKNGKVNGILCAISRHKFVPPPMVKEVFEIIAARAGVEIERKRTEETLRVSEEMYRSLFDNMLNGFAYCRMIFESGQPQDFIYLSVNHSFEELTGLKGVVGKKVTEVIPGIREADPGLLEIYGRVALSGNPERFEMYVESLRMWFWISVYSPHKEHFVAVFDVITERKNAEEALKESEERFRTITNTAGDAIICLEVPGNIKLWNKKAEEMFGYPAYEVMGRDMHDLIVPEKYREKAREGLKGFFQTGTGPVVGKTVELTALRKDGTEFPIALSISAMKIQEKWQATGIIRDITERKKAEQELAKHLEELERYMKATVQREFRIKELRDRVEELEKRLKG